MLIIGKASVLTEVNIIIVDRVDLLTTCLGEGNGFELRKKKLPLHPILTSCVQITTLLTVSHAY